MPRTSANPRACALPEETRKARDKISLPHHPGVGSRGLDVHMPDALRRQPCTELTIQVDQPVVGAAGDPQQTQLLVRARIKGREVLLEILRKAAGTKSANPSKLIQSVETRQQGFAPAHGKPSDGARVATPGNQKVAP